MDEIIDNLDDWPEMEVIRDYKWKMQCWKCGKETPHISYCIVLYGNMHVIGDFETLDKLLLKDYSHVKKVFSKTRGEQVITNTCIHCGALQGNFFIVDEIIHYLDQDNLDKKIPNIITMKDVKANIMFWTDKALYLEFNGGRKIWLGKSLIHSTYFLKQNLSQTFLIDTWVLEKNKIV